MNRTVFPSRPRTSRAIRIAAQVAVLSFFCCAPALATDPPIPAPGQQLPPHAAGGWPTATTGDDKKPGRTAEQQAAMDAVANELKRLGNQHGPDSVVLQAKLLMRSMAAGAVGPTEVRVAGPSQAAGPEHLEIDVETGLYFDGRTTTVESRRESVWKDVAIPVLDEMASFLIEPSALELVFLFDVQDFASGEAPEPDPTAESVHEGFRAQLSRALLDDLISDRLAGDAMREKVVFTPASALEAPDTAVAR